jgi:glycosyltransferase involved in cell wall biosynthesis
MKNENNKIMSKTENFAAKRISIVIPVFNNAESLSILLEKIFKQFEPVERQSLEIIFVDDGSTDSSWSHIEQFKSSYPNTIVALKLSRNFGQLAAMIAGWDSASGDAIINISADLQDPPEIIREMIDEWINGSDLVIGIRKNRKDKITSRFTSAIAHKIVKSSYPDMPDTWFDITLMSRRVMDVVASMKGRFRFSQGDMLYAGFKKSFVPYTRSKRPFGKSGYNFWKRVKNFTDTVLDSSYLLIQFFIRLGLVFSLASIVYASWIIIARLLDLIPSTGWAPLMVVLLITSGIMMIMLGIIAEYLWRIYDSTRNKPVYVIEIKL